MAVESMNCTKPETTPSLGGHGGSTLTDYQADTLRQEFRRVVYPTEDRGLAMLGQSDITSHANSDTNWRESIQLSGG